ncbi:unnamed protein product [Rhizoctonia solani]|uniref:Cutinase n=1 Tax=Rhizoctonia solani TaxID=456999 RepID=A0A8H3GQ14_9AGAM|nr:unnamed protein product [Rhizoctonia solani]
MRFKSLVSPLILVVSTTRAPVELEARHSCTSSQLVHVAGALGIGLGIVGTPLAAALAFSGVTAKSITYLTVARGVAQTEAYLRSQSAACPDQRFILSGYSNGALVLHALSLPSALQSKIASILVFGDPGRNLNLPWPIDNPSLNLSPKDGSSSEQNIASFCNIGDLACDIFRYGLLAHFAYPTDGSIGVAAAFARARP